MAKKIRLDFSKIEERSGWNTKEMPEGLHEMKVVAVEVGEAKDGTDMLTYALVPTNPKYKTRRFPFYCKLQQNQLWKLRDLIVATGGTVPKKVTSIDPDAPVGKLLAAEVSDETGQYAGRSTVDGTYSIDILDDDSDASAADEDDEEEYDEEAEDEAEDEADEDEEYEEEDDEDEEEDLSTLSLAELRKRAKGLGLDTDGVKKADLIELILEEESGEEDDDEDEDLDEDDLDDDELEDEEFEDDEEDEEEEPVKPARRAPAKKAAPAAKAAPARRVVKRR